MADQKNGSEWQEEKSSARPSDKLDQVLENMGRLKKRNPIIIKKDIPFDIKDISKRKNKEGVDYQ